MKKNKILILLLLFVFSECIMHASSMNQNRGRYVIISFERKIRGTRESPQMYFWIMPINDSLSVEDNRIYPLTYSFFDTKMVEADSCSQHLLSTINYPDSSGFPLFNTDFGNEASGSSQDVIEDFAANHYDETWASLWNIMKRDHKVIQIISKKWKNGINKNVENLSRKEETIIVSATAVCGQFIKGWRFGRDSSLLYSCVSQHPVGCIDSYEDFWKTPLSKDIRYIDFSYLEFWKYHLLPYISSAETVHLSIMETPLLGF